MFSGSPDTFLHAYFSPNSLLADANLTDTFKANLSSYPYPLYFSGVPIEKNPSQLTKLISNPLRTCMGRGKKVSKLEGIQYAKNLTSLSLTRNALTDLTPLSSLSNLSYLDLSSGGTLSSLNGISSLSNLTYLYLDKHRISSISPLVDLPYLYHLKIKGNSRPVQSQPADRNLQLEKASPWKSKVKYPSQSKTFSPGCRPNRRNLISPNDAQANFVFALELLLHLLEDNGSRSLKTLALSLGATDSIRSFTLPDLLLEDLDYGEQINSAFEYTEIETYLDKTLLKTLEIADLHLARITDESIYEPLPKT